MNTAIFLDHSDGLIVLRVPAINTATRELILGVLGVTGEFWGLWGVQRGPGGPKRGPRSRGDLLCPFPESFSPLEVLYGTRFGFKHDINVQMANIH